MIDLFIWLPLNYGTIFPFLLEIYLQFMLSRRLLRLIYFRRRFLQHKILPKLVIVNYACAFSQSELGKYFELIIIIRL